LYFDLSFPSSVRGPVLFWAFRLLASTRLGLLAAFEGGTAFLLVVFVVVDMFIPPKFGFSGCGEIVTATPAAHYARSEIDARLQLNPDEIAFAFSRRSARHGRPGADLAVPP
jgi:hypothetical protein